MTTTIKSMTGIFGKICRKALIMTSFTATFSAHAQTVSLASVSAASDPREQHTSIPTVGLQVIAYPIEHSAKVKVKFNNATGRRAFLMIEDEKGQIIYNHHFPRSPFYEGIFNLSLLESGKYTFQVSTLTKGGFIKHAYKQTFHIQSQILRRISHFEPAREEFKAEKVKGSAPRKAPASTYRSPSGDGNSPAGWGAGITALQRATQ